MILRPATGQKRKTLSIVTALLVLSLILIFAMACGSSGGGASPECLDSLYSGTMGEETRKQLSQPVSKMDTEARVATIKALSHQGSYGKNAESAECGEFAQELEAWEETDDGQEWHKENGEEIASQVLSFLGVQQCKDSIDYDYLREFAGDVKLLNSKVSVIDSSFREAGDYIYSATSDLKLAESFEDRDTFFQFDWELRCTVMADVNNRNKSAKDIEVVEAELQQDGFTVATYSSKRREKRPWRD